MTKKNLIKISLAASYVFILVIFGCIPEDSLQWNTDGSKGIYSKKGALYLVDGSTGLLTKIADRGTTTNWPAISPDGSQFVYGEIIKVDNLDNVLNKLSPAEVKAIKSNAEILKQKILSEGIKDGNLPSIGTLHNTEVPNSKPEDSFNEQHIGWVSRYLIEKADAQLAQKIGSELTKKIMEKELACYQLVLAQTTDPNSKKILATSSQQLWRPQFSPDSKFIAYVVDRITGKTFEVGFDLYVVSLKEKTPAVFVASAVAIGYDFRPDSRAIAYLEPEDKNFKDQKIVPGSLVEKTIVDLNGKFLVKSENDSYSCSGDSKAYAGVVYYSWMKVEYARDSRMFFSSTKISLPSSKLDTDNGSVFCCDTLTGAVSDILPQIAVDFTQDNYHNFSLSHDYRKILFPGKKNTLGIYVLGPDIDSSKIIVDANEGFGEDAPPKLAAEWKGSNQLSCLVSEKSHYLTPDPNTPHQRKEIVILDAEGKLIKILSKDWPDELLDY
jgi:Tol biopolymer transport system component